ncbi:hypothetical protein XSR1_140007 [Xenorhabdus szentirmaii DSM 16338]|uniref:Uncharacterized protein n=1 Tax=Xenorhabdus szentirmaii DSM 16338 TaxID=1427518 RepID=W1IV96_9GAMM|nr:hypothetical protein XSR1_140007 [Xenorhabdus szentirmaii DSM 16338]
MAFTRNTFFLDAFFHYRNTTASYRDPPEDFPDHYKVSFGTSPDKTPVTSFYGSVRRYHLFCDYRGRLTD